MLVHVDIWLRGTDFATSDVIEGIESEPVNWTDDDVRGVLEGMLRAMDRAKNPMGADRPVALRGLSWIVNAYETGGVVIAIEITLGAAIAGPFAMEKRALEVMITRVLDRPPPPTSTVH
jgi:hypothetical protein